jgi:hypothetical protein
MASRSRVEVLQLIAEGHFPMDGLRAELGAFPWDAEDRRWHDTQDRDLLARESERPTVR